VNIGGRFFRRIFRSKSGPGSVTSVTENPIATNTQSIIPWPEVRGGSSKSVSLRGGDYVLFKVVATYSTPLKTFDVDTLLKSLLDEGNGLLIQPSQDYFQVSVVEIVLDKRME
jgi:hypothetical protein